MSLQIAGVSIDCLTVCSGAHQREHESSVSLDQWIPLTKVQHRDKMFQLNDVIMNMIIQVDEKYCSVINTNWLNYHTHICVWCIKISCKASAPTMLAEFGRNTAGTAQR